MRSKRIEHFKSTKVKEGSERSQRCDFLVI